MRAVATPELTEDGLVAAIAQAVGEPSRPLRVGIGDDAAVWKPDAHHLALVTTDMLVDGVHFRSASTSPEDLGHKALAKNLSDIAAMAGAPVLAVVALGFTDATDEAWVRRFYRSMAALARRERCAVAGGDLVRSQVLTIAVTVVGEARRSTLRLRANARAGDVFAVTGPLGLAAAGLHALDEGAADHSPRAVGAYRTPAVRVREGRFFGSRRAVHALMDVSDGVSSDLRRMAAASGVDATIDAASLYVHPEVAENAKSAGIDPLAWVLSGGDDYELLAAIDARAFDHVARAFERRFGRLLAAIGKAVAGTGHVWIERDGRRTALAAEGWDHLRRG